jgi:hypothetical protein
MLPSRPIRSFHRLHRQRAMREADLPLVGWARPASLRPRGSCETKALQISCHKAWWAMPPDKGARPTSMRPRGRPDCQIDRVNASWSDRSPASRHQARSRRSRSLAGARHRGGTGSDSSRGEAGPSAPRHNRGGPLGHTARSRGKITVPTGEAIRVNRIGRSHIIESRLQDVRPLEPRPTPRRGRAPLRRPRGRPERSAPSRRSRCRFPRGPRRCRRPAGGSPA